MSHQKVLKIDGTHSSPSVLLDGVNGFIEFSGKSLAADTKEFYKPVLDWIAEYLQKPQPKTVLVRKMDATTTSFEKLIFGLTIDMATALRDHYKFEFHWYYEKDDEVELEYGQDFKSVLNEKGVLQNPTDIKFVEY